MPCRESGSTLRFLLPVAAAGGVSARFSGEGRLPSRPIDNSIDTLSGQGVTCKTDGGLPLEISGALKPGVFRVPGNISSQAVTGLLFALPLLDGDSEIVLTTPLQSSGYVDMTLRTLQLFGVQVQKTPTGYRVHGNQAYRPCQYETEGDWSQAAFFFSAAALSGELAIGRLNPDSVQGDRQAADLFRAFGAEVREEKGVYHVTQAALRGIEIDASQIPDLVPALAVTAAFAQGDTHIHSAERLRLKESDRISSTCAGLRQLGVRVEQARDGMTISGGVNTSGEIIIDGCNDHRIVMAFTMAACGLNQPVAINGAQAIEKSYPLFFEDFKHLGGICDVFDDR